MKPFCMILVMNILTTSFSQLVLLTMTSESLFPGNSVCMANTVGGYFNGENQTQTFLIIDAIFKLFQYSTQNHNFILFGGTMDTVGILQKYIKQSNSNENQIQSQPTASIIIDHNENENEVTKSFQKAVSSCIQSNVTDTHHTNIFIIQPASKNQAKEIISQISLFYKTYPSRVATIYFFVMLPSRMTNGMILNKKTSHLNIKEILSGPGQIFPLDSHLYILPNTDLHHLSSSTSIAEMSTLTLWELYCVRNKYLVFEPIRMNSVEFFLPTRRRKDFKETTTIGVAMNDIILPILTIFENVNGTDVFRGGKALDFVQPVFDSLNTKFATMRCDVALDFNDKTLTDPIDCIGWIRTEPNGSVMGMGQQLLNHEADFTLSFSELLSERIQYLDASHPSAVFEVNAYFRRPPPGLYRDIIVQAFSPTLWGQVAATWIIIVTFLVSFGYLKSRYPTNNNTATETDRISLNEAIYWAVGIACQQGWHYTPTSVSLQIIVLCGLFSSLLYYTAYSASIIAIFSVDVNRIHKLSDLLQHGFKLYGTEFSLTGQQDIQIQADKDGVAKSTRIVNATVALQKIKNSRTALIASRRLFFPRAALENQNRSEYCKYLSKSTQSVANQYIVIYYRKYDALKKFIDLQITRWRETGVGYRWNLDHNRELPLECEPKRKEPLPLDFQDVQTAFIILAVGFLSCLFILGYEILSPKNKRSKEDKETQTTFVGFIGCQIKVQLHKRRSST